MSEVPLYQGFDSCIARMAAASPPEKLMYAARVGKWCVSFSE